VSPIVRRGPRLTARERDRVFSEYAEMLLGNRAQEVIKLPGARRLAAFMAKGWSILLLIALSFQLALKILSPGRSNGPPTWVTPSFIIGVGVCFLFLFGIVVTGLLFQSGVVGPRRRLWRAALRKCGHDICVICGYLLDGRAADSRVCPECGTNDEAQPIPLGRRHSP